jgi:hypothetical protein
VGSAILFELSKVVSILFREKLERARQEQEHRHRLERDLARHEAKLREISSLKDALSIVIADRAMGETIREEIDAVFPRVLVETEGVSEATPK